MKANEIGIKATHNTSRYIRAYKNPFKSLGINLKKQPHKSQKHWVQCEECGDDMLTVSATLCVNCKARAAYRKRKDREILERIESGEIKNIET